MKIAKIIFILQTILILSSSNVFAVVTRSYASTKKGFYDNGLYNGIMLTEQGSLSLAPLIEKESSIEKLIYG